MESAELLRARATVREKDGIKVRSTPLSSREQSSFLLRSPRRVIQPIWVEVENRSKAMMALLPVGISRDYFPPDEVAYRNRRFGSTASRDSWFQDNAMPKVIPPGETRSGLVYAPQPPGAIAWTIELLGGGDLHRFAFAEEIPGFRADFDFKELDRRAAAPGKRVTWADLKRELERLQPCATDAKGLNSGDPLNVVFVSPLESLLEIGIRNGWKLAEPITLSSSLHLAKAVVLGGGYPTGPVSHMYVMGRHEDIAIQRPRPSAKRRNHMRLWLTDMRYEGIPVWIGQVSRDIGVRFTTRTWNLSTHKIAADVDEDRDNVVAESISTQSLSAIGWVEGVGAAPPSNPKHNLTGDPYFTDGYRAVMFLTSDPLPTPKLRRLPGSSHPIHDSLGAY